MLEKTKAFCDSLLERGLPGFDLAVYRNGECILRHFGGYSDLENKVPMNGKERYNIYSCSKVITCTAALQLYEKGLFSLEDKLSDYMPEFAEMKIADGNGERRAEKPILIRHLFEMTAGFSYRCASPMIKLAQEETDGRCATRELMRYLAKEPLLFEPGERWEYSLCHDVLAALVEVLSGERFESYVKTHIFDVAGMTRSTFLMSDSELDTLAEQYRFENGQNVNIGRNIAHYKLGSEYASGGAGGISTVDDYIKFLEALRTGKLISLKTLELMRTDRLTESQKRTYWTAATHGYGLGVRCPKGESRKGDFGWGGAAGAFLAIDLENELTVYFGAHQLTSPVQGMRSLLYRFIRAELIDPSEFEALSRDLASLHNYSLTY